MPDVYWDPLPTVVESKPDYLSGKWAERDWRNVPVPSTGRRLIGYEDNFAEFVYRQPCNPDKVRAVLDAAWSDPFSNYNCDGDDHWTPALIQEWWADRPRLLAWIDGTSATWSTSERSDEREAAQGLRDYSDYVADGLEQYLREYAFWLDNGRVRYSHEALPNLA